MFVQRTCLSWSVRHIVRDGARVANRIIRLGNMPAGIFFVGRSPSTSPGSSRLILCRDAWYTRFASNSRLAMQSARARPPVGTRDLTPKVISSERAGRPAGYQLDAIANSPSRHHCLATRRARPAVPSPHEHYCVFDGQVSIQQFCLVDELN